MAVIDRLLQERGFRLTYNSAFDEKGKTIQMLNITRPDTPDWCGVCDDWVNDSSYSDAEAQAAFELAGHALSKWDRDYWMYEK